MQLDIDGGRQSPFEDRYSDYEDLDFQCSKPQTPVLAPSAPRTQPTSTMETDGVPLAAPVAQRVATYCLAGEREALARGWPHYDLDGGRQSPFSDYDDYDYDSCCGGPAGSFDAGWTAGSCGGSAAELSSGTGTWQQSADIEMLARIVQDSFFAPPCGASSDAMINIGTGRRGKRSLPMLPGFAPPSKQPKHAGRMQMQGVFQGVPWRFEAMESAAA
mmetsp:Transcript_25443/g.59237  ORF Transcript_25443/g.59237 Transcript_25443/m.59237 type:complete len:217 (+) Transcript_25443:105-755(+)